jgi:hypothetical protein
VFIQYRAEIMSIIPVFGPGAVYVSPQVGHVHVTVDDLPWHFTDAGGETMVVVGLPAGEHRLLVELAASTHGVVDRVAVAFVVPERPAATA